MSFYLKISQNIKSTTRHLKFCYISIFYKSSVTDNETKGKGKNYIQLD